MAFCIAGRECSEDRLAWQMRPLCHVRQLHTHNLACTVQLVHLCGTLLSCTCKSHTCSSLDRPASSTCIACTWCRMWTRSSRKSKSSTKHNTYHPRWEDAFDSAPYVFLVQVPTDIS